MQRNIWIAYFLTFLRNSWFWMGVWIFYYLRFTDYAGIGLIEAVLIITLTLSEIPTGVIADLLGKKITLIISFIFQTLGMAILAFSPHLSSVLVGAFIGGIGNSLFSGTLDALIYESLKEDGKEEMFGKVIGKMTGISLVAPALCGVVGGFLYVTGVSIPFVLSTVFYAIGIPLAYFLTEPKLQQKGVSIKIFIEQTALGMKELFKTRFLTEQTLLLLGTGAISVICLEMLNDILAVEFGFKPAPLAIVWAILYVICAFISQSTQYLKKILSYEKLGIFTGIGIGITLLFSPIGGVVFGGLTIALRAFLQTTYQNVSTVLINERVDSSYRTTALSSFNLLKNIPYVFTAYFLGAFADKFTAAHLAFFLGVALILFIIPQIFLYKKHVVV